MGWPYRASHAQKSDIEPHPLVPLHNHSGPASVGFIRSLNNTDRPKNMTAFRYEIFADYHQFYLQDDDQSFGDLSAAWTEEATERLLAVGPHVIGIGTARNMTVPVSVSVHESRPKIREEEWDH